MYQWDRCIKHRWQESFLPNENGYEVISSGIVECVELSHLFQDSVSQRMWHSEWLLLCHLSHSIHQSVQLVTFFRIPLRCEKLTEMIFFILRLALLSNNKNNLLAVYEKLFSVEDQSAKIENQRSGLGDQMFTSNWPLFNFLSLINRDLYVLEEELSGKFSINTNCFL